MTEGQRQKKKRQKERKRVAKVEAQLSAVILCPYCTAPAKCVPDSMVYHRSYGGHVWWCAPCDAHVGCHAGTYTPKGRLSNASLRKLKIEAHALFDVLWKAAMELRGWNKKLARHKAYSWLATQMGIPTVDCHIGMFDEKQTKRVIEICEAVGRKAAA